ncbi:MAG: hypothetical protein K1Y02_01830 [Candidatus Hydrogenedentes bacterium]|nr:hypothetical protein [Candidatus Hydrogenedentota bacterium]
MKSALAARSSAVDSDTTSARANPGRRLKVMFIPLSYVLAHTVRPIEIAKVLRARGHEVFFVGVDASTPRSKMSLVRQADFRHVVAPEPNHPYVWDRFIKHGWFKTSIDLTFVSRWAPLHEIIESHVEIIRREKPDIVVGDSSVSASTSAYITGIPVACVQGAYFLDHINSNPYYRMHLRSWDRWNLEPMRRRVYKRHGVKPVNAMRLLCSIPILSPDLPTLYDPSPRCPHYHTVGPILFDHPAPPPEWMDELDDGTPNIYVSMGSTGIFDTFLNRTYEALGKLPYRFLVTTGGQVSKDTMQQAPANFRFAEFAHGGDILRHCAAMVYHGGNGTMYQGLAAGVPMVAVPAHLEQELVVRHAVRHGFCLAAPKPRKISGYALAQALKRVVEEPSFRECAQRFGQQVRETNGAERSADAIEQVAWLGASAEAYFKSARP